MFDVEYLGDWVRFIISMVVRVGRNLTCFGIPNVEIGQGAKLEFGENVGNQRRRGSAQISQ